VLPETVKVRIRQRTGLGAPPPAQLERLRHHYAYWREKWGWDLLNPDMAEIRRRHAGSELLWASDPGKRAEGERIVARVLHRRAIADGDGARLAAARSYLDRWGFLPPPAWSTLTSWEHILETIEQRDLARLGGDFVEIGTFLGGGTYQLARLLEREAPDRRVWALDIFDPGVDATPNEHGLAMSDIYAEVLGDGDQRRLYDAVTAGCPNIETVVGDSAEVDLPTDAVAFTHVDGNHDPAYVRSDFEKVWPKTLPGGVVAFDDYGHDLPQVTEAVDRLRDEHAGEIDEFWVAGAKTAFVKKAGA
jgi:hypothetical protein